jgi:hypothetical protein
MQILSVEIRKRILINPLNAQLSPIRHLLALLEAHHIFHVSRIRVNTFSNNSEFRIIVNC